jgi:circadian clock protein KaiC
MARAKARTAPLRDLSKVRTGIGGLDEITLGGLPRGRPTLVCGSAGSGKTLLAMEFLVRGATQFGEPGVFMSFEETARELAENVSSLGFDVDDLVKRKKLALDFVRVERSEIDETGDYDLEGLFIRLNHAIDSIGAKRVVLDTLETLFAGLSNEGILRAELRRLFRWLKEKGVTAVITGERGEGALTRHGLEEYISDCVILLDNRVTDQIATRRLRIVKYRGTTHGMNEYPFVIDETGLSVLPVTSVRLDHATSDDRVPSGIAGLDSMLGGGGYYRGSTILVSGTAGSGKTSLSTMFASAACYRNERCLFFAFEESSSQIIRNMRSIGVDLEDCVKKGLLRFQCARPTLYGLEMHLATIHKLVQDFQPTSVVFDPVTSFVQGGTQRETTVMLTRLIDFLKGRQITALMTSLTSGNEQLEATAVGVSSLVDTWLLLRDAETNGERNRLMYILKSRGMSHSNQLREFLLTAHGVQLRDVYLGPEGMVTGSARLSQESRERAATLVRKQEMESRKRARDRRRDALEARITALRKEFEVEERESQLIADEERAREQILEEDRASMGRSRQASKMTKKRGGSR